jgi:GNAT superfamily N-acetyltransferase
LPNDSAVFVAGDADRDRIADMLARAFIDDPATSFIFPDPVERAKRLPRLFRLLYDEDSAHGVRLVTREGEAATLWREPGYARTGLWPMIRQAIPMLRTFGPALGRALAIANAIDAHLPQGKYWYLHIAGCDPVAQGKGYGGAAVRGGLPRAMPNLPAHLETATEKNLGFYRGLGFEISGEYVIPKGGPRFWTMWRPAGS